MSRRFKTVDYDAMLKQTVSIEDCLPPTHLARFIVEMIGKLDLSGIYQSYGPRGGIAIAPEILLGLLLYGYATGVFSSREIERATHESIPFRFIAGNLHPDHDTIAHFRVRFLVQIQELFIQVLEQAVESKILVLENISVDGSKIHADASKSHAVSYKRLGEIQVLLRAEVVELLNLGQTADSPPLLDGVDIPTEVSRRQAKIDELSAAKIVLESRAQTRYELDQAAYALKMAEREAQTARTGRKIPGRVPLPPFLPLRTLPSTTSPIRNPES
jgi:transposase